MVGGRQGPVGGSVAQCVGARDQPRGPLFGLAQEQVASYLSVPLDRFNQLTTHP